MLIQPTIEKLYAMRLRGMAEAFQQQQEDANIHSLSFEERLGLLIDRRVAYDFRTTSDFGKLTSLGTEGRSTATTILSLATIRHLRKEPTLDPRARKLLSFTDNRQDASLQAGHEESGMGIACANQIKFKAASYLNGSGPMIRLIVSERAKPLA